jgi:hypothetical protein
MKSSRTGNRGWRQGLALDIQVKETAKPNKKSHQTVVFTLVERLMVSDVFWGHYVTIHRVRIAWASWREVVLYVCFCLFLGQSLLHKSSTKNTLHSSSLPQKSLEASIFHPGLKQIIFEAFVLNHLFLWNQQNFIYIFMWMWGFCNSEKLSDGQTYELW